MREDQLIAFLTARGVDFEHVAGSASNTEGDAAPRRMTNTERKEAAKAGASPTVLETVKGSETRVYRRPSWSLQELALASRGMPIQPELAVCYSIACDFTARPFLVRELRVEASHLAKNESWPSTVRDVMGKPLLYLEPMIGLLLDEEAHRGRFVQARPAPVHAWLMNVHERTWEQVLLPKYARLQEKYEAWLTDGRARVRRRIMGAPCVDEGDKHPHC
jgi:hypothetical protein